MNFECFILFCHMAHKLVPPSLIFLEIIQLSHDVGILLSSILFNIRNNFNCCIRHLLNNKWPIQCQSILFLIKLVNQTSDPCI